MGPLFGVRLFEEEVLCVTGSCPTQTPGRIVPPVFVTDDVSVGASRRGGGSVTSETTLSHSKISCKWSESTSPLHESNRKCIELCHYCVVSCYEVPID